MAEIIVQSNGLRLVVSEINKVMSDMAVSVVPQDWVMQWSDVRKASEYRIHLFSGIQNLQAGDTPVATVVLQTSRAFLTKSVRLQDLTAITLPTGFHSIQVEVLDAEGGRTRGQVIESAGYFYVE